MWHERNVLFIINNHESNVNRTTIDYTWKNCLVLLSWTLLIRSLLIELFASLSRYNYRYWDIDERNQGENNNNLCHSCIRREVFTSFNKSYNHLSGFWVTDIFPLDRSIFIKNQFFPYCERLSFRHWWVLTWHVCAEDITKEKLTPL